MEKWLHIILFPLSIFKSEQQHEIRQSFNFFYAREQVFISMKHMKTSLSQWVNMIGFIYAYIAYTSRRFDKNKSQFQ